MTRQGRDYWGKAMKLTKLFAITAFAVLLAGCFTAEQPLLTDANSVAPYEKISFREKDSSDGDTLTRQGNAYLTVGEDVTLTMRFMPLDRPDWYVVEVTGEQDGEVSRLYALVKVDLAANTAETYKAVAGDNDAGPGLRRCEDNMVCIDDLAAYIAHALAAIDAGAKPDAAYEITLE